MIWTSVQPEVCVQYIVAVIIIICLEITESELKELQQLPKRPPDFAVEKTEV